MMAPTAVSDVIELCSTVVTGVVFEMLQNWICSVCPPSRLSCFVARRVHSFIRWASPAAGSGVAAGAQPPCGAAAALAAALQAQLQAVNERILHLEGLHRSPGLTLLRVCPPDAQAEICLPLAVAHLAHESLL